MKKCNNLKSLECAAFLSCFYDEKKKLSVHFFVWKPDSKSYLSNQIKSCSFDSTIKVFSVHSHSAVQKYFGK